jgi:hypothetical protein
MRLSAPGARAGTTTDTCAPSLRRDARVSHERQTAQTFDARQMFEGVKCQPRQANSSKGSLRGRPHCGLAAGEPCRAARPAAAAGWVGAHARTARGGPDGSAPATSETVSVAARTVPVAGRTCRPRVPRRRRQGRRRRRRRAGRRARRRGTPRVRGEASRRPPRSRRSARPRRRVGRAAAPRARTRASGARELWAQVVRGRGPTRTERATRPHQVCRAWSAKFVEREQGFT